MDKHAHLSVALQMARFRDGVIDEAEAKRTIAVLIDIPADKLVITVTTDALGKKVVDLGMLEDE